MAAPAASAPPGSGRSLAGRYRLLSLIARGGMAEVWEAEDEVLGRRVAVKLLREHLAADGTFLERFRREAIAAARLAHPNVVATYDTGVDAGTPYIVMELVRGPTLRQLMDDCGRLEPAVAVSIASQIAGALVVAHRAGLVHRDIKPGNVLLDDQDLLQPRVKVTDFGIAKASEGLEGDLTRTGVVLGTPKYLSPEQISGSEPDFRADLYSLGVVLYEMLAGSPPFKGTTEMATALAHLHEAAPRASSVAPGIPQSLDDLVAELLVKDPAGRVQSAAAVRQRLTLIASELPQPRMPPRVAAAASPPATVISGGMGAPTAAPWQAGPERPALGSTAAASGQPGSPARPRRRRPLAGMVVAALVAAGLAVAGLLVAGHGGSSPVRDPVRPARPAPPGAAWQIRAVTVFMVVDRPPDNPQQTYLTYDGNPATYWSTARYTNPEFGNLYPGIGLEIELAGTHRLDSLVVTSPSRGWSAQSYVSQSAVPSPSPLADWGKPTDTVESIQKQVTTFDLGGRTGRYVLLWLTNLGPADQTKVAELSVR